jgi:hypothetical protein
LGQLSALAFELLDLEGMQVEANMVGSVGQDLSLIGTIGITAWLEAE